MATLSTGVITTTDGPGFNFTTSNRGIVTLAFETQEAAEKALRQINAALAAAKNVYAHAPG